MTAMNIECDFKGARITLQLENRDAVQPLLAPARDQGFLLLLLEQKASKPFLPHEMVLTCDDGFRFSFEARPVQFFEKGAAWETAFQLDPWTADKETELEQALAAPPVTGNAGSGQSEPAQVDEGEVRGASPTFRIKAMDPNQRARLAMTAGRTERQLLRRDRSPQVLVNLLSNPRVEAEDVLAVVKSPTANAGLLERVVKDRRWSQNLEIKTAIARNPKTPSPTVIRLLDALRTEDLRQMARVGALRENVRREALRVYMKRTGQRT